MISMRVMISLLAGFAIMHPLLTSAQTQGQPRQSDSDAGRPSGPLQPPSVIAPLTGNGVVPLSPNYLGNVPNPTKNGFQNPPGFLPRGQENRRPDNERALTLPVTGSTVATLPPASTGRQGLPSHTWALLTPRQKNMHLQAEAGAMSAILGEGFMWDDDGRHGEVRAVSDRILNNQHCRDFTHLIMIDGQRVEGTSTVCR